MSVISKVSLGALEDPMLEKRVQILIKRGKLVERLVVLDIMEGELNWASGMPMTKEQVIGELRQRNNSMMDELIRRLAYLDKDMEYVVGAAPPRMVELMHGVRTGQQVPLNMASMPSEPGYSQMASGGTQVKLGPGEGSVPLGASGEERVVLPRRAPQVPPRARGKEGLKKTE